MTLNKMSSYLRCAAIALLGVLVAMPAFSQDPYEKPDGSWITIDGTVETVTRDAFTLDYGDGIVTVEMDDGDRDADGYKLLPDDKVRVFGRIDDDFFEATTIEASSVYVEKLGTYFYASAMDEEDVDVTYFATTTPIVVSATVLRGVVTEVDEHSFKLNTGMQAIDVDVEQMSYNPLDDIGYQRIDVGDYVWVSGSMTSSLLEGRELVADSIVILYDSKLAG